MTVTPERRPGRGWNAYAAILLIFAGAMQILEAWGWVYLIAGVVLIVIGVFIFRRAAWAALAGIAAAFLGAMVNLFWIFSYPLVSVLAIALYMLAAYGLTTDSLEELD